MSETLGTPQPGDIWDDAEFEKSESIRKQRRSVLARSIEAKAYEHESYATRLRIVAEMIRNPAHNPSPTEENIRNHFIIRAILGE